MRCSQGGGYYSTTIPAEVCVTCLDDALQFSSFHDHFEERQAAADFYMAPFLALLYYLNASFSKDCPVVWSVCGVVFFFFLIN